MKSSRPYKVPNFSILKILEVNFPFIAPLVQTIFAAYKAYAANAGSPHVLRPITLAPAQAQEFRRIMDECYGRARVRDGLRWIKYYRENHGHSSCPMCGAMHARTIDHYLPKAKYPEYAIYALNLIPSCITCNQHRSDSANWIGSSLPMLHPFYDKPYIDEGFLYAVNVGSYEAPRFLPSAYHSDSNFLKRIGNHINLSIDEPQFHTWALDRWSHVRSLASRCPDVPALSAALNTQLNDEEILTGPNNWTAALLRGILRDPDSLSWLIANPLII